MISSFHDESQTKFVPVPSAPRQALAAELKGAIEGEVRFDAGSRALYATDASNYRQVPIGVVIPGSNDFVGRPVSIAGRLSARIL
jgi:hypothetical protein